MKSVLLSPQIITSVEQTVYQDVFEKWIAEKKRTDV